MHDGRVRVVAEEPGGTRLTEFELDHGADPVAGVSARGFGVIEPIDAKRVDGDLVISFLAKGGDTGQQSRQVINERDEPASIGATARQRVAAYAWVESDRGVLAAKFYRNTPGGRWTLPGGGIGPDEEPVAAVHREVMEETAQTIDLGDLVDVNSRHWIGRNRRGELEDFHSVRLIYRAECPHPTEPRTLEIDGSTIDAAWFPYSSWQQAGWMPHWRDLLVPLFSD